MNSADELVPEAAVNGRAAELAATDGVSLNQFIAVAVAER
jgi:predicted HicB family RNase H-like nuclease